MQPSQRPQLHELKETSFKMPQEIKSEHGIPLYVYEGKVSDVCRVDIIFFSGAYNQLSPLTAQVASETMVDASTKRSSREFSELIDFYGGWVKNLVSLHYTTFSLYSPNRSFKRLVSLFFEAITSPRFSKRDFNRYKRCGKESLKVVQKRVENISQRVFKESLFGKHPYGVYATPEDYDNLQIDAVRKYVSENMVAENCKVVFSGAIDEEMIKILNDQLYRIPSRKEFSPIKHQMESCDYRGLKFEEIKGALQSAVVIGARSINRDSENYIPLHILNCALGGYFGCRLNKNIREEKGYTYGINSWLIGLPDAAYLIIASQTATRFTKPLIEEVKKEIDEIKSSLIPTEELLSLKNFLVGDYARMFDTCFTLADYFITILTNRLDVNYYDTRLSVINSITPEKLLETAQNYLPSFEDMCISVAGKME